MKIDVVRCMQSVKTQHAVMNTLYTVRDMYNILYSDETNKYFIIFLVCSRKFRLETEILFECSIAYKTAA